MVDSEKHLGLGTPKILITPDILHSNKTIEAIAFPLTVNGKDFKFSVAMGDITEAETEAVFCPSNDQFAFAGLGAIERVILAQDGAEAFKFAEAYVRSTENNISGYTPDEGLPFGSAFAAKTGQLESRGIKNIIFSNVLPPLETRISDRLVSICLFSAMREADRVGARSLALPMIGMGFLGWTDDFTKEESLLGTLKGLIKYKNWRETTNTHGTLEKLIWTVYVQSSYKDAVSITQFIERMAQQTDTQTNGVNVR